MANIFHHPYEAHDKLIAFASNCDVVTYENENIPYATAQVIERIKPLYPNSQILLNTQDRLLEKKLFEALAIPVVAYAPIHSPQDLLDFIQDEGFPVIIKHRTAGYDGKGQFRIANQEELMAYLADPHEPSIVEKMISFDREVSLIGVRSSSGEFCTYDLAENTHHQGILHKTQNRPNDPLYSTAQAYLRRLMTALHYVGCLGFEFFDINGTLVANELAPRVHNTGHWTIEGAVCSQFENHLRAITGLPLGDPKSLGRFEMVNLLGRMPSLQETLQQGDCHFHDYQKTPKTGRKVGHLCKRIE